MDFVNNSGQQQAAPAPNTHATGPQLHNKQALKSKKELNSGKAMRVMSVVLLVLVALIIGLLLLFVGTSKTNHESKYVDSTRYQAVFLNGGQVYFGKINSLNDKFITINSIYYLRVNQQVQPNQTTANSAAANQDVSLAKLGCELHGPTDVMVINREQVLFWENLKTDGQVTKAISDYVKANPKGQDCTAAANNNGANGAAPSASPAATPIKK